MQAAGETPELSAVHLQLQRTQSRRSGVEMDRLFRRDPAAIFDAVQIDPFLPGIVDEIDPGPFSPRAFQSHEIFRNGQHARQLKAACRNFHGSAVGRQ